MLWHVLISRAGDSHFSCALTHSERTLVAILARRYSLSERQVWRILKQPRTPGEATQ